MSTLIAQTAAPLVEELVEEVVEQPAADSRRFHAVMACASFVFLVIAVVGSRLVSIHVHGIGGKVVAVLAMLAMVAPLPAYWHQKRRIDLRDAALTIPWTLSLIVLLPFPILVAARLRLPLRDALLAGIDRSLGINVPGITAWASHHWLGSMLNGSYNLLAPLLLVAIFAPALAGKLQHAKEFLLANLIAFAVGAPVFALFPAIGPWNFYHLAAGPMQHYCETQLLALRLPGIYFFFWQGAGIVCFPSFHVLWAVLCAAALWGFRPLRIPIAVLSTMIVLSTMTTGWHYFTDVLGGLALACLSLALARAFTRSERLHQQTHGG